MSKNEMQLLFTWSPREGCKICSKLTIKTAERQRVSGVFIVNFEHKQISHLVLVFPLLTLSR